MNIFLGFCTDLFPGRGLGNQGTRLFSISQLGYSVRRPPSLIDTWADVNRPAHLEDSDDDWDDFQSIVLEPSHSDVAVSAAFSSAGPANRALQHSVSAPIGGPRPPDPSPHLGRGERSGADPAPGANVGSGVGNGGGGGSGVGNGDGSRGGSRGGGIPRAPSGSGQSTPRREGSSEGGDGLRGGSREGSRDGSGGVLGGGGAGPVLEVGGASPVARGRSQRGAEAGAGPGGSGGSGAVDPFRSSSDVPSLIRAGGSGGSGGVPGGSGRSSEGGASGQTSSEPGSQLRMDSMRRSRWGLFGTVEDLINSFASSFADAVWYEVCKRPIRSVGISTGQSDPGSPLVRKC